MAAGARDNHDKEMLRTMKRIATALEKIAQNTGPKHRTVEVEMRSDLLVKPNMIKRLDEAVKANAFGNDGRGEDNDM